MNPKQLELKTSDFKPCQRVIYSASHCNDEYGCVSSINSNYVFVKFDLTWLCIISPDADYTAQACLPDDLQLIGEHNGNNKPRKHCT